MNKPDKETDWDRPPADLYSPRGPALSGPPWLPQQRPRPAADPPRPQRRPSLPGPAGERRPGCIWPRRCRVQPPARSSGVLCSDWPQDRRAPARAPCPGRRRPQSYLAHTDASADGFLPGGNGYHLMCWSDVSGLIPVLKVKCRIYTCDNTFQEPLISIIILNS